jgi:thymidylate kinase
VYAPDGVGKSTLIDALRAELAPHYAGIRNWHFLTEQDPDAVPIAVVDPHGQAPRSTVASIAKVFYYLLRAWLHRGPRIAAARRAGHLVILDRDVPDAMVDPRRYRMQRAGRWLRLLGRWAPRPHLAIVLEADVEVVLARSRELDARALEDLRTRYRAFADERRWVVVVDANQNADAVARAAIEAVRARLEVAPEGPGSLGAAPR